MHNRNKQQIDVMHAFEEKCRRLYETRLFEYTTETDEQLSRYEEQLLTSGSQLASERARFESRVRRLRLACSRWKTDYQAELHDKYQNLVASMEVKYMSEVERLLETLAEANSKLAKVQSSLFAREKELLEAKRKVEEGGGGGGASASAAAPMSARLESLLKLWQGLGTPSEERVQILAALLDSAQATPELTRRYEAVQSKLTARLPIMQMLTRKQYLEYKLTFSANSQNPDASAQRPTFIAELDELRAQSEAAIRAYERQYGEKFVRTAAAAAPTRGSDSAPSGGAENSF